MTAPTQGKELGAASTTRGPFPPYSSPFPRSLLRATRPPAAHAEERGPPLGPAGRWGAPGPLRSCHLTQPRSRSSARSAPGPPARRGLAAGGARTPSLGAEWMGRRRTAFQESQPLPGPPQRRGSPLRAAALVCAPSDPLPPRVSGHWRGWSVAPSGVLGAEGGRDPAWQGWGSWKTHFG